MKTKLSQSNTVIIIVTILVIGLVGFGIYKLSETNVFDSSGRYVKELADDKDIKGFMEKAKAISYYDIISGELEDFEDTPIKYWGYITDKEVATDKTATYTMFMVMNKADTAKAGSSYDKTSDGLALAPVIFKTSKAYNTFSIGDYIWMYGTLSEFKETEEHNKVPYFEARKLVLDTDIIE